MNKPLEIYQILEGRVTELHPDTRDKLLFMLVGFISKGETLNALDLHGLILNLEKSDRQDV